MSRTILPSLALLLSLSAACGQGPVQPTTYESASKQPPQIRPELPGLTLRTKPPAPQVPEELPRAVLEQRWRFDPRAAEVKLDGRHWALYSGKTLIKDFGDKREQAFEARRLIADLSLNEHGVVGTPEPVMEYWLSNGEAPPPPSFARDVIPFDPKTLRMVKSEGAFYVRDERQVIYNFGPYESDAQTALGVLKRYGFNELGFVGLPHPSMSYLVRNDRPRTMLTPADAAFKPRMIPQQTNRLPLVLPKLGPVGERVSIDPMRVELQKMADGWHLMSGPRDVALVGQSDYSARESLRTVQRYPLNDYVRLGTSGYGFYLSWGRAPQGVPVGVRNTRFDPAALSAKQLPDQWVLTDGKHVVATFAPEQGEDAKLAVKVLQHYGFDSMCEVGSGLHYLAKER
jgi:hypothetical protein